MSDERIDILDNEMDATQLLEVVSSGLVIAPPLAQALLSDSDSDSDSD